MNAEDADILVVTETKTPEMDLPALNDRYEVRLSPLNLTPPVPFLGPDPNTSSYSIATGATT